MTTRPAVLLLLAWLTPGCITESTWDENIVTSCELWSECASEYCRAGTCVEPGEIGTSCDGGCNGTCARFDYSYYCVADCQGIVCPDGYSCLRLDNLYEYRHYICFPTCTTDSDCPRDVHCSSSICDPDIF